MHVWCCVCREEKKQLELVMIITFYAQLTSQTSKVQLVMLACVWLREAVADNDLLDSEEQMVNQKNNAHVLSRGMDYEGSSGRSNWYQIMFSQLYLTTAVPYRVPHFS
jgi:hypothetical protein